MTAKEDSDLSVAASSPDVTPKPDSASDNDGEEAVPVTPTAKKRGQRAKSGTPYKKTKLNADGEESPSGSGAKSIEKLTQEEIDRALADDSITSEDKQLIKMKCIEKKSWKDITNFFEAQDNKKYSTGALCIRFTRLVPRLITVDPDDLPGLTDIKEAVDNEIEDQKKSLDKRKWGIIADALAKSGKREYPSETLERAWKAASETE